MSRLDKLYIAATGMITPVGANTVMTATSVKAGISAYGFSNFYFGTNAIKLASVPDAAIPGLKPGLAGVKTTNRQVRMLGLAHAAINQIPAELINGVPLFLAGPEPLPEMPLPMRSNFIQLLQLQAEIDINFEASKVYPMGRAAGFYALESAFQYLEVSAEEFVLVGGVDSYKDFVQLDSLAQVNRIQTESGQSDAFIPGEGAAFILLSSNERFRNNGQVFRPGIAEEIGHRYSDEPYLGNGLSSAFSQAIEHAKSENIGAIYSSLNGESFGVKEFGVACTRNRCNIADSFNHVHPADCFGDLGGATSIVLIALASMNENTETLCFGASDHEFRGVAVVS